MSIQAFEKWFVQGLPADYFKKGVVQEFAVQMLRPDHQHEESLDDIFDRMASSDAPQRFVGDGLFACNMSRQVATKWRDNDVLSAIGLQLASLGVSTQYEVRYLYFRSTRGHYNYQSFTLMRLVSDANLNHIMVQFPDFDLAALLDRIKVAISDGAFHARWTHGLAANDDYPIRRGNIDSRHDVPSYVSAVTYAHYSGGAMPPDLNEHITADSVKSLISFQEGVDWRPAFAALVEAKSKHDFNQGYVFDHLLSQAAPLAKHAGVDPRIITKQCSAMMEGYRASKFDRPASALEAAYARIMLMNILWDRPDLWTEHGLVAADLLGVPYQALHQEEDRYQTLWRDSMIGKNHTGSTLGDRMLIPLGKLYPELYDPRNIGRKWGTCTARWYKGVKDFEPARDIINDLMNRNIWHYALENNRLSHLFGEEASLSALNAFLSKGGSANEVRARKAIEQYPGIIEQVLARNTKGSEIKRLAQVHCITSDQLQALPAKLRDAVFSVNLGL